MENEILGIISDTHRMKGDGFKRVMDAFDEAGVGSIVHCGDMIEEDLCPKKYRNRQVTLALVDDQGEQPAFKVLPSGWKSTKPGARVIPFNKERAYVGHRLAWNSLNQTSTEFQSNLDKLRVENEWLRYIFSGHTHVPFLNETGLVRLINPGAITGAISGYCEYAILNTETYELSFVQLYPTETMIEKFVVGVVSDSSRISLIDPSFWARFRDECKRLGVEDIIHCGNIAFADIGRPELAEFQVHYNLREDQKWSNELPKNIPPNWHLVGDNQQKEPVVTIKGYRFCVQLDLGSIITQKSVTQTESLCQELRRQYHELDFVLCGFTHNCLFIGGLIPYVMNPGDIINDRNFATIELGKRIAITFAHVPLPA
jgi:putative phosphoesterase